LEKAQALVLLNVGMASYWELKFAMMEIPTILMDVRTTVKKS